MLRVAVVVLPLLKLATSLTVDVDIDINTAAAAGTDPSEGSGNPDIGNFGKSAYGNTDPGQNGNFRPPWGCPREGDNCKTDDDCPSQNNGCLNGGSMVCRANMCLKETTIKEQCPNEFDDCETDDDCKPHGDICLSPDSRPMKCGGNIFFKNKCVIQTPKKTTTEKPGIIIEPPQMMCKRLFGQCETDSDCCQHDSAIPSMKGRHIKCSVNKRCFYNFWPGGSDADDSCVPEGETCQADKKCCHCVESEDHVCFCKDGKCCDHNICTRSGPIPL